MVDPGFGKRKQAAESLEFVPWYGALVAASAQPVPPRLLYVLHHYLQHLVVAPNAVVLIVATQFLAQHLILLRQLPVPVIPTPLPQGLHRTTKPLPRRLPLDHPVASARFCPEVGESEKVECAVPIVALRLGGRLPEPNQRRLRRVYGQFEAPKPLRQHHHHPLAVIFPLAADHEVSSPGESHPQALSEPGVNLSVHRAPIIQPPAKSP